MLLTLECQVYHTQLGESLLDVARLFSSDQSPAGIKAYLAELIQNNNANLKAMSVDPQEPTLPIRPYSGVLCLPPGTPHSERTERLDANLAAANWLNYSSRRNLNRIIKNHADLQTLASTGMLLAAWQQIKGLSTELAIGAAITLPHLYSDYLKKRAEILQGKMKNLQAKINDFAQADKTKRAALKPALLKDLKEFNEVFNQETKALNLKQASSNKKIALKEAKKVITGIRRGPHKKIKNQKLMIDSEAYRSLASFAKYMTYTGRAFTLIELGRVLWNTKEAYHTGDNWQKELFEGMAEFIGGYVGSWVVMFIFAGAGWWIIIPGTAFVMGTSAGFKWIAKQMEN